MEYHVAPMINTTTWAFRATCLGATDSYTGMVQLEDIIRAHPRAMQIMDLYPIAGQNQWVQILTNKVRHIQRLPASLKAFSEKYPEQANIYGVNINIGCPDPQIIAAGQGAALIKRRQRIVDLVDAFLKNTEHNYHLNLKFRLGLSMREVQHQVLLEVLERLYVKDYARLNPPIIHFKHAKQQSNETPLWGYLNPLIDSGFPFILNGEISSPQDLEVIQSGLQKGKVENFKRNMKGIMIGRALFKNPFTFLEFHDDLEHKKGAISWKHSWKENIKKHPPPPGSFKFKI